jgi:hypothetical protein
MEPKVYVLKLKACKREGKIKRQGTVRETESKRGLRVRVTEFGRLYERAAL